MTSGILAAFRAAVRRHPNRTAIIDGHGRAVTFAALLARADDLARAWHARGIWRGDRVLLAMRVDSDLYASLAALWSLGATVVLPEPAMGLAGLRHAARATGATVFCSNGPFGVLRFVLPELWRLRQVRPHARGGPTPAPHDPDAREIALISFTSGTTGLPKAIPRSHGFLSAQHRAIAPLLESGPDDRDLVAFPVFVLINLASGRTSVLPNWKRSRRKNPRPSDVTGWMEQQGVTRALLPPASCEVLVGSPLPAALHTIFTGGGPVFPHLLHGLKTAKPSLRIICVYGSTEAEPIAHLDATDVSSADLAAMTSGQGLLAGHPVADIRVRIMDDEVQVAGPHVNSGYLDPAHDAENKIAEGGTIWHRTGDAGRLDDRGRLWLLGRLGTQVRLAHDTAFPFAVEVATMGWQGVRRCALMPTATGASLVIEGDVSYLAGWREKAGALSVSSVRHIARIPMDKRHGSKVDRVLLRQMLGSGLR